MQPDAHRAENERAAPDGPGPRVGRRLRRAAAAFVLLLALGACAVVILRIYSYRRLLGYSPRVDYRYRFRGATALRVEVSKDGFVFPRIDKPWDTAFLEMRVAASPMGTVASPVVEVRHEGACIRQYLERGVRGVRYLLGGQ